MYSTVESQISDHVLQGWLTSQNSNKGTLLEFNVLNQSCIFCKVKTRINACNDTMVALFL